MLHTLGRVAPLASKHGPEYEALAARLRTAREKADRWQDLQRIPGADGYLYAIEFSETRGYIERVLENYATYRRLYAGAPMASIR